MIPSIGRIVHYTLSGSDADAINRRRADAKVSNLALDKSGGVVHVGNAVTEGDVFPAMIVRTWGGPGDHAASVQLQVFLDGNDTFWATSREQQSEVDPPIGGRWAEPVRVG